MWILIFQYSFALENDAHSNRSIVVWRHNGPLKPMMTRYFSVALLLPTLDCFQALGNKTLYVDSNNLH